MDQDQSSSLFGMQADTVMQSRLTNFSKWAKFISITGIILVLLAALVFAAAGGAFFNKISEIMGYRQSIGGALLAVGAFFVAVAVVWFYLLLRASTLIRQGIISRNQDQLAEGFKMLRFYFIISVVITVCSFLSTVLTRFNFLNQ